MSNNFEISLRSKSAEQLLNMSQNSNSWSSDQLVLINAEIKKRGLEVFEEPEPWNDSEMKDLNTDNPESEFEKDMAVILDFEQKEQSSSGLKLAAQIVSTAALITVFSIGVFMTMDNYILLTISVLTAFVSLGLSISKQYLAAIITGGISLLALVGVLITFLKENL